MERNLALRGQFLAEQVVSLGLIATLLLVLAAMTIQMTRSGHQSERSYEAMTIAQNRLELLLAGSVSDLPLGILPGATGKMQDGTDYKLAAETYAVTDPQAGTLTDKDLRRIRVAIEWTDNLGSHTRQCEGLLSRIPQ